jgi:Tol biopolymer transport system component
VRIAFASYRSGASNIWVADSDGTDPVQLTHNKSHSGTPNWSPDGSRIVYDSLESGNWDIYVVSSKGGTSRRLTAELSSENVPSWSWDGRWIYFASDRSGNSQIWRIPAEGGEAVRITRRGGFYARESLDGRHLYYTNCPLEPSIWQVPSEGGEEIEVVKGPLPRYSDFALSSSGIYYVTVSTAVRQGVSLAGTIHFLDFESGQTTDLIRREGVSGLRWVVVSPDEEWIIWVETLPPEADLVLVENFH